MEIFIDTKELKLLPIFKNIYDNYSKKKNFTYIVKQLDIGDIVFLVDSKPILIIERKTINDLASSIYDGRYKEQSFRLDNSQVHNHNIIYLVEGNLDTFRGKGCNKTALCTSFGSLIYFKGFSLMRTKNLQETAEFIFRLALKIFKDEKSYHGYYKNQNSENLENKGEKCYTSVISCKKKDNITTENIGELMLMQIPGISFVTAHAIMSKYSSLIDLICDLQDDENILEKITYENSSGKQRKLNKTCIENINKFLMHSNE